jgi:vacuolar-type H+-ATPase subunit E/Vma4
MDKKLLNQKNEENALAICSKIREDTDYETKNMLARANKEAQRILREPRDMDEKKKEGILKDLNKEIEKSKERVISALNLEKKKLVMEEKRRFAEDVLDNVKKQAQDFRNSAVYPDFLEKAIVEGSGVIDETEIEVLYSFLDENIMHDGFIKKIENICSDSLKRKCFIKLKKSDFKDLGVIVNSCDGRMMYDNRFLARLARIYEDVYMELLKESF